MRKMIIPVLLLLTTGCVEVGVNGSLRETDAYVPIYSTRDAGDIKLLAPQPVKAPGKIYIYGDYLLINEVQKGIHVFDNSDITAPKQLAFIQLLGNVDMAVRDGVLYADYMGQLVALNVGNFSEIETLGVLPLSRWLVGVPPPGDGYFECIDESKGIVVGWKKEIVKNPKCRYNVALPD